MKTRFAFTLVFAFLIAIAAAAQSGTFRTFMQPPYSMGAITGAPYSADQTTENKQTLADGTHISRPSMITKMFRDSAGRTRTERPIMTGFNGPANPPSIVEIYDVVGGYRYVLDTVNKIAHRSALPPRPEGRVVTGGVTGGVVSSTVTSSTTPAATAVARPAPPKAANAPPRPETSDEKLGTQIIEGLNCEGRRTTMTYPVGAMGNDRPLVRTMESWFSPELKVMVLSKNADPQNGEFTMTLKNLSRVEPEYSLFQPPPDYKLVDETGSFELVIKY